ncbi:MAG: hypothetical protein JWS12_492 [Candidatus Saccharibacteria bacterium]|nr:hypothetical protein [Candidatus Saccharibacteria bacterium]
MVFTALGIISSLIFLACDTPYLLDTIKNRIKPHRVTWGIIFLLNATEFANQLASGARNSLWIFGAATLMTGAIFAASLKNGVGGHTMLDIFSLTCCMIGLLLWTLFNSPSFSIFASIFVAIFALIPTYVKARKAPETETRIAFLGGCIASALAAVAVGKLDWHLLILPISGSIEQAYMVYLLYVRPGFNLSSLKKS